MKRRKRQNFFKSSNPMSTKGDNILDPISSQELTEERKLAQQEIDIMYWGQGFAKRLLNDIASSSIKSGFTIESNNKSLDEKVMKRFVELECADYLTSLIETGLKDGIAFLFPVLEGFPLATGEHLDLNKIVKIKDFNIFYARDIIAIERQMDKMKEQYGKIKNIDFKNPYGEVTTVKIDSSWLTGYEPFPRVDKYTTSSNYTGDSFFKRIWELLIIKDSGIWSAGQLAYAALLKILKIADKGQLDKILREIGLNKYKAKKEMEINSSTLLVTGVDDDFQTVNMSQSIDFDKLKNYIYSEIAIDTGIPVSRLVGTAQGALASAKEDSKKWYEYIEKFQKDNVDEMLRNIIKLLYAEQGQYNIEFELNFNSIRSMDEKEEAEINKMEAEKTKILVESISILEKNIKDIDIDKNVLENLKEQLISSLELGE